MSANTGTWSTCSDRWLEERKAAYLQHRDDPADAVGESLVLRAAPEAWLVRSGSTDHSALPVTVTPGLTAQTAGTAEVPRPITQGPDVRVI